MQALFIPLQYVIHNLLCCRPTDIVKEAKELLIEADAKATPLKVKSIALLCWLPMLSAEVSASASVFAGQTPGGWQSQLTIAQEVVLHSCCRSTEPDLRQHTGVTQAVCSYSQWHQQASELQATYQLIQAHV